MNFLFFGAIYWKQVQKNQLLWQKKNYHSLNSEKLSEKRL